MSFLIMFPFFIVISIVVIFMVLYPRYYKNKINKDLEKGNPIRVIEPIYLYGGLMFAILIIMSIFTFSTIKSVEDSLRMTFNSRLQSLEFQQQNILTVLRDLKEDTEKTIEQGALIQLIEYEVIEELSAEEDLYLVKLTFALTENTVGHDGTLHVESSEGTVSYDLESTLLRQTVELELNLQEDYLIYVEIDDGEETTTHDFEVFNLYEYLIDRFTLFVEFDATATGANIDFYLLNQWENSSVGVSEGLLKIQEVQVTIIHDDVELTSNVYTTPTMWSSHSEQYGHYYEFDTETSSGTWQVIITVIDHHGIAYTNLLER